MGKSDPLENLMNAKVLIGLKAQGHIPTIEKMLAAGKSWQEIGDVIGWCPKTAEQHYQWYLEGSSKSYG